MAFERPAEVVAAFARRPLFFGHEPAVDFFRIQFVGDERGAPFPFRNPVEHKDEPSGTRVRSAR